MTLRVMLKKHSYLYRLIAMAVLVLLAVLLMFSGLVMSQIKQQIKQQRHEYYLGLSHKFAQYFSEQIAGMRNNAIRTSYDNRLKQEIVEAQTYNEIVAIDALSEYLVSTPIAAEIDLYYRDADYLLSSNGKYSYKFFLQNHLTRNSAALQESLNRFLQDSLSHSWSLFGNEVGQDQLLVSINDAVSIRTSLRNVTVFYIIDMTRMQTALLDLSVNNASGLSILSADNQVIYQNDYFQADVLNTLQPDASGVYPYTDGGVDHLAYIWVDASTGMKYVTAISVAQFELNQSQYLGNSAMLIWLSAAALIIALILLVYVSYKPVHSVAQISSNSETRDMSELQSIQHTIKTLGRKNEQFASTLNEQHMLLMDCIIACLLEGVPIKADTVKKLDSSLADKQYVVLVISGLKLNHTSREMLMQQLSIDNRTTFITDTPYENHMIFICCLQCRDDFERYLQHLVKIVEPFGVNAICVGVGTFTDQLVNLNSSYIHAVSALRRGKGIINYCDSLLNDHQDNSCLAADKLMKLFQHIEYGGSLEALQELDSIFAEIKADSQSIVHERFQCFGLLHEYINSLEIIKYSLSMAKIDQLIKFNSTDELHQLLRVTTTEICDLITRKRGQTDAQFRTRVVAYVDQHYMDNDISLIKAADMFNMSIYTFSRLFKEFANKGFREYIIKKRIETGYKLLEDTDLNVKDIASKVGYAQTEHFTKLIKNYYGLSPSEIRNNKPRTEA